MLLYKEEGREREVEGGGVCRGKTHNNAPYKLFNLCADLLLPLLLLVCMAHPRPATLCAHLTVVILTRFMSSRVASRLVLAFESRSLCA